MWGGLCALVIRNGLGGVILKPLREEMSFL